MAAAPIVLVPGYWLGAWAWDEVAADLRADGHDVTAMTLPGLESAAADRSTITLSDHVDAICQAVEAASAPVGGRPVGGPQPSAPSGAAPGLACSGNLGPAGGIRTPSRRDASAAYLGSTEQCSTPNKRCA